MLRQCNDVSNWAISPNLDNHKKMTDTEATI